MNWISGQRQPKRNIKAKQQVFFALRRQTTTTKQVANRVRQTELLAEQAEYQSHIKHIRGSFDIYALDGKEEYVNMEAWPDAGHFKQADNCSWSIGDYEKTDASPMPATYDGYLRLTIDDWTSETAEFGVPPPSLLISASRNTDQPKPPTGQSDQD